MIVVFEAMSRRGAVGSMPHSPMGECGSKVGSRDLIDPAETPGVAE
jgi:hypothetical protein